MKPLSILHVNTMDRVGGAAQLAFNLVEEINAIGHKATMAVRSRKSSSATVREIDNDGNRHGWARFCLRTLTKKNGSQRIARVFGRPWNTLQVLLGHEDFDFPGTWHLLANLPEKPDLLHLHNLHGNYFDLRALPWLSQNIPTVVTLHDSWLINGHVSYKKGSPQKVAGFHPHSSLWPRPTTTVNKHKRRRIFSQSRLHLVTPSKSLMREAYNSHLTLAIKSSIVINNAIDLKIFTQGSQRDARLALNLPSDCAILMFAAAGIRDNPWKDFKTLRRTFKILSTRHQKKKLLFLAVGDSGASEFIGDHELRFIAHSEDQSNLAKYYHAADLYIHATKSESWGLTITEAMACGRPVVASDVGGIPDQVTEGKSGFLVPVGDEQLMAQRIMVLLDNPSKRVEMGRWAYSRAHAEFGITRMADNYLDYYSSILKS